MTLTRPLNTLLHHTLTTYLRLFSHTLPPPSPFGPPATTTNSSSTTPSPCPPLLNTYSPSPPPPCTTPTYTTTQSPSKRHLAVNTTPGVPTPHHHPHQHQNPSVAQHVIHTATITTPLSNPSHINDFLPTTPPHTSSPQKVSPPNTPILEISSRIHPRPSYATFKITTRHHSDALSTHPILSLMHSTNSPNCHLEEILIPEPYPHLRLFVVSSTTILPYTPLRIRPPSEPPPPQQRLIPAPKGKRSESNNPSLITSYFKRSSTQPTQ